MKAKIGIVEGDYIGPEITKEGIKVLKAISEKYNFDLDLIYLEASGQAYDKYGEHLPKHTLDEASKCDALLKGPFGGPPEEINNPKWATVEKDAILGLRKYFNLYTNMRMVKTYKCLFNLSPLKEHLLNGVDILIVRELISGIYFGEKNERIVNGEREYSDSMTYKESEIERIAIKAFDYATKRRKKVTLIAKSNILKSSILWREVVNKVAKSYPEIENNYMHVDNAAMQLILNPRQFDVILTSNMFGDILSDEASVLGGSIGLFPSASLCDGKFGLYEPIHGSAPSIAGKNIANPTSSILSVALMLRYSLNLNKAAIDIENAVEKLLELGYRTIDIYTEFDDKNKLLGTREYGDAIVKQINGT